MRHGQNTICPRHEKMSATVCVTPKTVYPKMETNRAQKFVITINLKNFANSNVKLIITGGSFRTFVFNVIIKPFTVNLSLSASSLFFDVSSYVLFSPHFLLNVFLSLTSGLLVCLIFASCLQGKRVLIHRFVR